MPISHPNDRINKLYGQLKHLDSIIDSVPRIPTGDSISAALTREFLVESKSLIGTLLEAHKLNDQQVDHLTGILEGLEIIVKNKNYITEVEDNQASSYLIEQVNQIIETAIGKIVTEDYNLWAPTYNKLVSYSDRYFYERSLSEVKDFLERNIRVEPGNTIWDVGTGTGFPSLMISRIFPDATVYASDTSSLMLNVAQDLEKEDRWEDNSYTVTGIIQRKLNEIDQINHPRKTQYILTRGIPVKSESLDAVVMCTAIPSYAANASDLCKDIFRCLKDGSHAMINFSYMGFPRFILLAKDYGLPYAQREYRKSISIDMIEERTIGDMKVLSFKVSFTRKVSTHRVIGIAGLPIKA